MRKRGATFTNRVDPLAAFKSASRQQPLDDDQKTHLSLALRVHLEALATGNAGRSAFDHLANGVNLSMAIAKHGNVGLEYDHLIGRAQVAMCKLKANGNKGRWLLDGANLCAMKDWIEVYEAQMGAVSQQETLNALKETDKLYRRGQVFEDQPQGATP